jgi:hypothetical protein
MCRRRPAEARSRALDRPASGAAIVVAACVGLAAMPPARAAPTTGSSTAARGGAKMSASSKPRARLAVLVVVDQLGSESWNRWLPLADGGFAELARRGAVYPTGRHAQANTATGPGHASIATGAWPNVHGVVSNEWYDANTGALVYCVGDPEHEFGPKQLAVPTLADQLRAATQGRGRVVSIAIKDRVAILLGGQRPDLALWYDYRRGALVHGRWSGAAAPAWLAPLRAIGDPEAVRGQVWDRLRPDLDYAAWSTRDDNPWEGQLPGLGRTFPRTLGEGAALEAWREPFRATPALLDGVFTIAERATVELGLGADDAPDLLAVGASSLDFVGHYYGPRAQESLDVFLRTDRALGRLMRALEARLGRDAIVYALTGDHGAALAPEDAAELGLPAMRIRGRPLEDTIERALAPLATGKQRPVKVKWIDAPLLYLDWPESPPPGSAERTALRRAAARALRTSPHVLDARAVEDVRDFAEPWRPLFERVVFPGREPDLLLLQRPHDVIDARYGTGSNHGTPYAYDMNVPIVIAGPGVRASRDPRPVDVTRIVPTLSALLHINPPAAALEAPLPAIDP